MDIEHIRPFIYQTISTFETLLGIRPEEQEVATKDGPYATYDVSAIIGISGSGTGGVVLSFPKDVACKVCPPVEQMAGDGESAGGFAGELAEAQLHVR